MGGGPSRGTGPIYCEEVAELLGEHYYDEAWRVFEKVAAYRKDAHGAFVVPFHEAPILARAFANDLMVRYGDDPNKLVRTASLFTELAAPYANMVDEEINVVDNDMAVQFLAMAEQLSAGFEAHSENLRARVEFLKRCAKEEADYQIQLKWEAEQREVKRQEEEKEKRRKAAKKKKKTEDKIEARQRRIDREKGVKSKRGSSRESSRERPPEPPETLEAAATLTREAMGAVMRGDRTKTREDRKKEFEDAERRYGHALRIYEKVSGRETMDTAVALNRLAWHLKVREKYAAADSLFRRSLAIREKLVGPRASEVLIALSNLADNCQKLKKHAEADSVAARAAFLRTLHHTRPAVPDGVPAAIEWPRGRPQVAGGEWED